MHTPLFVQSFVQRNRKITAQHQACIANTPFLINNFDSVSNEVQSYSNINLEIGFGKGEFLLKMASLFPEELFIGCEPFMSGVAHVLQDVAKHNIANIRIFNSDARILLSQIALPLFNRIFILFPDPWPKARHHKRRIINRFLLDQLLLLLKTKGQIHIVTDSDDYAVWIDTLLKDTSELKHLEEKLKIDNFNTSYYQKAKKNNNQIHIFSYYK